MFPSQNRRITWQAHRRQTRFIIGLYVTDIALLIVLLWLSYEVFFKVA